MLGSPARELVVPAIAPQDAFGADALYRILTARDYAREPQDTVISGKQTAAVSDNVYNMPDMFTQTQLPPPNSVSVFQRMLSRNVILPLGKANQAPQGTK